MHKKSVIIILLSIAIFQSCNFRELNKKVNKWSEDKYKEEAKIDSIAKVRTQEERKAKKENGVVEQHKKDGTLINSITYKNGKKNGIAKKYYPDGSIHSEVFYKDNIKEGESIWYYLNGNKYRTTNYKKGIKEGKLKRYYESGELKSEQTYANNNPVNDLKEYTKEGKLKTNYPKIILTKNSKYKGNLKFVYINIKLSKKKRKTKFYLGKYKRGWELYTDLVPISKKRNSATLERVIYNNSNVAEKIYITVIYKTKFANYKILQKSYNLYEEY